jgi:hypothetical protein
MKTNLLVFTFSILVLITRGQTLRDSLIASPNIFSQRTLVSYTIATNDTISINIYNTLGISLVALRTDFVFSAGVYQDSLIMDNFPDGMYLILMKNKRKNLKNVRVIKAIGTNIQKSENNSEVKIYPNPSKDILNVDFGTFETQKIKLNIIDNLGQVVYSLNNANPKEEIDLSFLASGVYYLRIESDDNQKIKKVIKE